MGCIIGKENKIRNISQCRITAGYFYSIGICKRAAERKQKIRGTHSGDGNAHGAFPHSLSWPGA